MFGYRGDKGHYYGSEAHRYINKMIKSSKAMYIVSPYIDSYYADLLAKRSSSAEFYIISSSMEDKARNMLQRRASRLNLIVWTLLSVAVFYVEINIGIGSYLLALSLLPLLWGLGRYMLRSRSVKGVHLKIPKQFVHAKMYISDDQVISGSANLTYKGTHSNVEHIEISRDPQEVEQMQDEFWRMWKSY